MMLQDVNEACVLSALIVAACPQVNESTRRLVHFTLRFNAENCCKHRGETEFFPQEDLPGDLAGGHGSSRRAPQENGKEQDADPEFDYIICVPAVFDYLEFAYY